jgi:prepilin-type N-terminal cleavage/methylation domain-containing protein
MTRNRQLPQHGFVLIEMLCVILLVSVLTGVLALMIKEALHAGRAQAAGFDRTLAINALADVFRSDVAQADDAPESWQQYKADKATLILRMPHGVHVIYVWQDGSLLRRAIEDGKTSERQVDVGDSQQTADRQVDMAFIRETANGKLVRLRLQTMHGGDPLDGQTLTIAAALGGDHR